MEVNNWKTIRKKTAYDNPWIRVEHRDVTTPAGNPGIYGIVHFKNKAIGIVPVDDDGFVYLVGQYRYPLDEYSWEIPEGGGPIGEVPLTTARRELKEETGLTAEHWQQIGRVHTSNSVTDEEGFIFLARGLTPGDAQPEETEELLVKKIPLSEAVDMVMRFEITDSIATCGILMAARILGR
ncbi:MAG: NUDIX domain-containing protein [Parapedobacter sp.]